MVRLKVRDLLDEDGALIVFQFQNGTIKSNGQRLSEEFNDLFQFQNGTIKSNTPFKKTSSLPGFNSKMVRLKAKMWEKL